MPSDEVSIRRIDRGRYKFELSLPEGGWSIHPTLAEALERTRCYFEDTVTDAEKYRPRERVHKCKDATTPDFQCGDCSHGPFFDGLCWEVFSDVSHF